jgi:hypothetical protein
MTRRRSKTAGQALAEFALVAPFFFLLLLGIIEAGRFIFYYEMLSSATREGARYAIVHGTRAIDLCPSGPNPPWAGTNVCDPDGDKVKEAVRDAAIDLPGTSDLVFDEPFWETNNYRGEKVRVAVSFTYQAIVPVLPGITVSAESTLVINN